jgi:putative MFS transporter
MTNVFTVVGLLAASIITATLSATIGFRGLLLIGAAPAVVGIWAIFAVPESPRWLADNGRPEAAGQAIAKLYKLDHTPTVSGSRPHGPNGKAGGYRATARLRRSFWAVLLIWLIADGCANGFTEWVPTLFTRILGVSTGHAALLYSIAAAAGIVGRIAISFLARLIGRKLAGVLYGSLCALFFALTATFHSAYIGTISVFLIGCIITNLFMDGSFGNIIPFTSEIWPNELRSHGTAVGATMGGIGKIIGPVGIALIVGASNLVTPAATVAGVFSAFLFFAACMAVTALVFAVIAPEPHGKKLSELATLPGDNSDDEVNLPG